METTANPKFRRAFAAVLLASVFAAGFAARANAQAPSATPTADEAAIAAFNRRYLNAINEGDIDTLASLTTDGHMMISSGGAPLVGKQALVDAMARLFQTAEIEESWAPEETVVSGDLAYQRGTFVVVFKPKSAPPSRACPAISYASIASSPTVVGSWCATCSTVSSRANGSEILLASFP